MLALVFGVLDGSSHGIDGAAFASRLVLACTGSPLPWTPHEEARATGVPPFGLEVMFNQGIPRSAPSSLVVVFLLAVVLCAELSSRGQPLAGLALLVLLAGARWPAATALLAGPAPVTVLVRP